MGYYRLSSMSLSEEGSLISCIPSRNAKGSIFLKKSGQKSNLGEIRPLIEISHRAPNFDEHLPPEQSSTMKARDHYAAADLLRLAGLRAPTRSIPTFVKSG